MNRTISLRSAGCLLVLVGLAGCGGHDPRTEVPGHLEPGPVKSIVQQMHSGEDDNIERIAKAPIGGYVPPNIAFLNDPELAYIWFDERIARDGESLRFGHWAAVKVRESSFQAESQVSDAMYLNGLDEVVIGKDGQVRGKVIGRVEPQRTSMGNAAPGGPWSSTTKDNTKLTVMLDDGAGPPRVVGDGLVPGSGDPVQMQDMINRVKGNLEQQGRGTPPTPLPPSSVTAPLGVPGAGKQP